MAACPAPRAAPPHAASVPPLVIETSWPVATPSSKSAVDVLCSQSSHCHLGCLHAAYRDTLTADVSACYAIEERSDSVPLLSILSGSLCR